MRRLLTVLAALLLAAVAVSGATPTRQQKMLNVVDTGSRVVDPVMLVASYANSGEDIIFRVQATSTLNNPTSIRGKRHGVEYANGLEEGTEGHLGFVSDGDMSWQNNPTTGGVYADKTISLWDYFSGDGTAKVAYVRGGVTSSWVYTTIVNSIAGTDTLAESMTISVNDPCTQQVTLTGTGGLDVWLQSTGGTGGVPNTTWNNVNCDGDCDNWITGTGSVVYSYEVGPFPCPMVAETHYRYWWRVSGDSSTIHGPIYAGYIIW